MSPDKFGKIVNDWSINLSNRIERSLKADRKVVIIALSRKMPRFFDWLMLHAFSEETLRLVTLLMDKRVEVTTEYAIPVLTGDTTHQSQPIDGIVADDVVIFGATANRVCLEWQAHTGVIPYFTTLVRSDKGKLSGLFESSATAILPMMSLGDLEEAFHHISKCIMKTSLPVDMEYPIVHVDLPYEEIKEHVIKNNVSGCPIMIVKSDMVNDCPESFTVVFEDEAAQGYNNDFVKARFFKKIDGCCIEIIAPNAIKRDSLLDREKFPSSDCPQYNEAWTMVFDAVSPGVGFGWRGVENSDLLFNVFSNSKLGVMNVWANYLFSLSIFSRHKDSLIPSGVKYDLKAEDIALITGLEMAQRLKPVLDNITRLNRSCTVEKIDVALPFYINPSKSKDKYFEMLASAIDPDASLERNLDNLFSVSHFTSPVFANIRETDLLGHHNFGETYDSIASHVRRVHHSDSEMALKIHSWIDRRIDESRIAPKYELVTGSDGNVYYRRFFLCGSNSMPFHNR